MILTIIIYAIILKLRGVLDYWLDSFCYIPEFSSTDSFAETIEVVSGGNNVLVLSQFMILFKNLIVLISLFFILQGVGKIFYIERGEIHKIVTMIGIFFIDHIHFYMISTNFDFVNSFFALFYLAVIGRVLQTKMLKQEHLDQ